MAKRWGVEKQTAALVDSKLINTSALAPATIAAFRAQEKQVLCATCREPVVISISDTGPFCLHSGEQNHLPEDPIIWTGKKLLLERMRDLFSQAKVERDVFDGEEFADITIVLDNSGKIVVRFISENLAPKEVLRIHEYWEALGVRCLWIADWRKLNLSKTANKNSTITAATLGKLETALIKIDEPLLYMDIERRNILTLKVPGAAAALVRHDIVPTAGRLKCFLQRYRIGQLRLSDGDWRLETTYDTRPPKVPDLPKRLQDKLELLPR